MKPLPSIFGALLVAAAGCSDSPGAGVSLSEMPLELHVECAAPGGTEPGDRWTCPDLVQVACDATDTGVPVVSPEDTMCDVRDFSVSHPEPLTLGTHPISVRDADDSELCTSKVEVRRASELELVPKHVSLWPPNHKLHEIRVTDCVEIRGACAGETLSPRFIWVSSDEPADARGDGHHAPDISVSADCKQLSLRSERQGPSDGRVYTLGVRLVDAAGDAYETSCTVSVDHDQRGRAAVGGSQAYRLELDGSTPGIPGCVDDDAFLL